MIRLHAALIGDKAKNGGRETVMMRGMVWIMARVAVGTSGLAALVAQNQPKLRSMTSHSDGVRALHQRSNRQQ
jgi:hypothetical protein